MLGLSGYARVIKKKLGQLPLILEHLKVIGYTSRRNNFSPPLPTFSTGVSSYRKEFAPQEQILSYKSIPHFPTGFAIHRKSQKLYPFVKDYVQPYTLPIITAVLKFKHLDFAVSSLVKFMVGVNYQTMGKSQQLEVAVVEWLTHKTTNPRVAGSVFGSS